MADDIITPGQLADELETGKWDKGRIWLVKGGFEGKRYCCLGVAGRMLGFTAEDLAGKSLPDTDHAMWSRYLDRIPWAASRLFDLAALNDYSGTWEPVVAKLREIDEELNS